ncbi:MAG: hypothetical protein Q4G39_09670 [Brachymonas sp.]|nr:hypothetical protein [Brachymonas sp.]
MMPSLPYLLQLIPALMLVTAVWLLFASPLIWATYLAAKFLRQKTELHVLLSAVLSFFFALLAAPVPTPIITFFIPLLVFAFSSEATSPFYSEILQYAMYSFAITWCIAFFIIKRYIVSFDNLQHQKPS